MGGKHIGRALLVIALFPCVAFALGLGDIKLNSALNAPLDADIELVGAAPEEIASLKAQLATRETFARYGLDYPNFLSTVTLTKGKSAAGRDVLKVRSQESVTEPFVTLLVDVNWGRGRLVREYTVLLDPPVFTPGAAQVAQVAPPATGSTRAGSIERTTPNTAAATSPAAPASGADAYNVRPGDTLTDIAARLASGFNGASREQIMLALYRENPTAFDGSMNELHSGAILRVPSADALAGISAQAAANETRRQYSAWRGRSGGADGASSGRLRLIAPTETGTGSGATSAEVKGLRDRLAQVENELTESRRMLELKNAELADLQRRLGNGATPATETPAATPPAVPPAQPPVAATPPTPATETPPVEPPVASGSPTPPAVSPPTDATTPNATQATPEPVPAVQPAPKKPPRRVVDTTPADSPSFLDSIVGSLGNMWPLLAGLGLAIAGFFGYRKFQAARAEREQSARPRYEMSEPPPPLASDDAADASTGQTSRLRRPNFGGEPAKGMLVEESGEHPQPKFPQSDSRGPDSRGEDTLSGETGINLDHSDPLAEADFHMAYGLYDQAADLVRTAIARDPGRRDLKLKLVEVFFVWGNRDEFLATARDLHQTRSSAPAAEWEKIAIMGRQIAADDPLFAGTASPGSGGVDLDLASGDGKLDFDLLGDAGGSSGKVVAAGVAGAAVAAAATGLDFDFASTSPGGRRDAPTDGDTAEFAATLQVQGVDRGGGTTREMIPEFASTTHAPGDLDIDFGEAPTVEQPALRTNSPTIRQKIDAVMRQSTNASDQTAEVAIDDLGLDLGDGMALDGPEAETQTEADAPTLVAGLDAESQRLMEGAAAKSMRPETMDHPNAVEDGADWFKAPASPASKDTGATASMGPVDFNLTDRVDSSDTAQFGPDQRIDSSPENDSATMVVNGAGSLATKQSGTSSHDLDLTGAMAVSTGAGMTGEELSLPALEPMTISEVGTKLDLARAYMDMGDPDGARSILNEVLQEGSVSQKQEAKRLVDSLPG